MLSPRTCLFGALLSASRRYGLAALVNIALGIGIGGTAQAALITSSPGGTTLVDFSQFGPFTFTQGPVEVGGLVGESIFWSSTGPNSVIGSGGYGLADNGDWNLVMNGFTALNFGAGDGDYTQFQFNDGPVNVVGGFVNYAICPGFAQCDPAQHFIIQALGAGNGILETYDISALAPIITPGGLNAGAFRGIERSTNDIVAFRTFNAVHVLDNLEFARTSAVPEPSTLGLIGVGLLGLTAMRRRRRNS